MSNLNIGAKYQDTMDPTRTVVPVDNQGTCKVYYGRVYHGKTFIPPTLFVEHGTPGTLGRIGFTLKG